MLVTATSADPDFTVGQAQARAGAVQASLSDGDPLFPSGQTRLEVRFEGVASGQVTLDDNRLEATARGLATDNALLLDVAEGLQGAEASILTVQNAPIAAGVVDAQINVGSVSGVDDAGVVLDALSGFSGSASISGNRARAEASGNAAENRLELAALGSVSGGSEAIAISGSTESTLENAGFGVVTLQILDDGVSSGVENLNMQASVSGDALSSAFAVRENALEAFATGNDATNAIVLSGERTLEASGGLINTQSAAVGANILARVNGDGSASRLGLESQDLVGAASIEGNSVVARAVMNQAENAFSISGASLSAANGGFVTASGGEAQADFVALNRQEAAGTALSVIQNVAILATFTGGGPGTNLTGNINVANNLVGATAMGNSSGNVFRVAADGQSVSDFAFGGRQALTGAVSASVSDVSVGISAGASGSADGAYRVSGNVISAQAVGNSSTTSLQRGGL